MVSTRITPNSNPIPVPVVGGSEFGRVPKISPSKTYNMYISSAQKGEENWLFSFAGYQKAAVVASVGAGRGMLNSVRGNFLIFVVNNMVYKMSAVINITTVGTLNTSSGEVFIAENLNSQICIVDGVNVYIYNYATNAFAVFIDGAGQPLTTGALVPSYVDYHNTYFLFGNAKSTAIPSSNWYVYAPGAGTTLVYTQTLALQTKADFALAPKTLPGRGNNIVVFGSVTAEVWTQISGTQVYQRNPSINIDYGCISTATIGESDTYIVWLAQNEDQAPIIMAFDGNEAVRISTDGIDYLLSTMKFPDQSTGILYRIDGHLFYQLTFFNTADNITLLYDFNTKLFFNLTDHSMNFHPARDIVYFNELQYFVSLVNGDIYQLDSDFTTINENIIGATNPDPTLIFDIPRFRITPSIREADSTRFIANSLVLTLEQGMDPNYTATFQENFIITEASFNPPLDDIVTEFTGENMITEDSIDISDITGLPTQIFYQPRIDLAISKDAGITWSSNVARGLHPLGYRKNILHWESMGVANDLCFRFNFVGLYRFCINQAILDVVS